MTFFEIVSEQSAIQLKRDSQRETSGVHVSGDYSLVLAKIDSLAKKIEGLSTSTFTSHSVYMVQAPPICDTRGANHGSSSFR